MAKVIQYKFLSDEVNHGTKENPNIEQIIFDKSIECATQTDYDANYPIAEREAVPGTVTVEGEFDTEAEPTQEERLAELEEALEMILNGVTE